jgi:hypothetical protein
MKASRNNTTNATTVATKSGGEAYIRAGSKTAVAIIRAVVAEMEAQTATSATPAEHRAIVRLSGTLRDINRQTSSASAVAEATAQLMLSLTWVKG